MKLAVEVGGRSRTVEIRRGNGSEVIEVDGRRVEIDLVEGDHGWSMLLGRNSYQVACADEAGGVTMVHVNGRAIPAVVTGAGHFGAAARRARGVPAGGDGPQRLVAPMPGRIVKLLAQPGEDVAARQGIVVIEAMKMENELRSPKAGTVREITVKEGASVEAGAVLAIVE
ncbi:MAG: biotin/lipoyl-containing protein [Vicinamibacterales bacterium]